MIDGVRYGTERDTSRVVEMARAEHALSKWKHRPFDPVSAAQTTLSFITTPGRTLLVTDGGFLAGLVQPMGFSRDLLALEYAWYSGDGTGIKLLRAFEQWAERMGAASVVVHAYVNDERISDLLRERRGYKWLGSAMTKTLEG